MSGEGEGGGGDALLLDAEEEGGNTREGRTPAGWGEQAKTNTLTPPHPPHTHTHRLLGVTREASFEEVQDARNYLYEVSACECEREREG